MGRVILGCDLGLNSKHIVLLQTCACREMQTSWGSFMDCLRRVSLAVRKKSERKLMSPEREVAGELGVTRSMLIMPWPEPGRNPLCTL